MLTNIFTSHALSMAELKGYHAEIQGERLIVSRGSDNFSLLIVDGIVSGLSFERAMVWLANQSAAANVEPVET
jgi:hypothetical protein